MQNNLDSVREVRIRRIIIATLEEPARAVPEDVELLYYLKKLIY